MLRRILVLTAHRHVSWENSERQLAPRRQRTRAPRRRTSTGIISTTALTAGAYVSVRVLESTPLPMGRNAESIATKRSHSLEISTPDAAQGARDQASERPAFHADTFPPPPRTSAHSSPCSLCVPSPTRGAQQ